MSQVEVPKIQRALVLQGGGALGAYDAGVFQALYEKISSNTGSGRQLFDVVAGTSSGAMNAAILVSNTIDKGWDHAATKLNEFWDYVSTQPYIQNIPGFTVWWKNLHSADPNAASEEAARRYYSTKQFMVTGVQNVFFPLLPIPDTKFFDPQNIWPIYSNRPLKDSLERYAKFPIATSPDLMQPRLLLVSVDVLEGAVVTFDSYPKVDGSRKSEYGEEYTKLNGNGNNDNKSEYEFTISYDDGIVSDHAIASGSVPVNYDYSMIMANRLIVYNQVNRRKENVQRYFWDGGITTNTPLRELIQSHKDYWLDVVGKGKENATIPDLDVYIVDVWPTKEETIPMDHDSVIDRKYDLLLCDKTDYDEKVADIVSDYIGFVSNVKGLAVEAIDGIVDEKKKKNLQTKLESVYKTEAKSSHRNGKPRTYQDLLKGRFDINVIRIQRTDNADNDISTKLFDYSANTIKQLRQDGYHDAQKALNGYHPPPSRP
jgi:NTE family protein